MNKTMWLAKKMLPEYIFDTAKLEGNPLTFPEIQTLMDGITVGGHKISDQQQILNLKSAWLKAFSYAAKPNLNLDKAMFLDIHSCVAKEEALEWGVFRSGSVGIAGTTTYTCPPADKLDTLFTSTLENIQQIKTPVHKALQLFLNCVYNQFFWDGNKRTSRIIANIILMHADIAVFNIKAADILEFNTLMLEYYNTNSTAHIMPFLLNKCIHPTP